MASWRSQSLLSLPLGAVALLALASCGDTRPARQNYYATREQCERDYDARLCYHGGTAGGGYYGPYYYSSARTANDYGPGRTAENGQSRAASSVHVTRGGFGATGRGYGGSYG